MKVLMFGWEFPPYITGGLGTACYGITKGMQAIEGLDIFFVVPRLFGEEQVDGVEFIDAGEVPVRIREHSRSYKSLHSVKYIEVHSRLVPYVTAEEYFKLKTKISSKDKHFVATDKEECISFVGGYGVSLYKDIFNYSVVASIIAERYDFDIIHAHDWLTYKAGIAAKEVSGKKLVIHVHATEFDRTGGNPNLEVYEIEKEGIEKADRIITVSNLTRKIVIDKYGATPEKVTTVYNASDFKQRVPERVEKGFDEKLVTFLGRVTLQKGPKYFIESAYRVLQSVDNIRFVMAGGGDMLKEMIRLVTRKGIAHKFHFTGYLTNNEVAKIYKMSDLFVMPSVSEPFGIVPLEALQSGVPVIISKQSGVSEVLKNVISVDYWDIEKMAESIISVVNNPALSNDILQKGNRDVLSLNWEKSAKAIYKIYKECIAKD